MEPAFAIGLMIVWLVFACLGAWVASQKRREPVEGFFLGLLFGPFGCLIEAVLPTLTKKEAEAKGAALTPQDSQAEERQKLIIKKWKERREAEEKAEQVAAEARIAKVRAKLEQANVEREAARKVRRERLIAQGIDPDRNPLVLWFIQLSDLSQALLMGAGLSLVALIVMSAIFSRR